MTVVWERRAAGRNPDDDEPDDDLDREGFEHQEYESSEHLRDTYTRWAAASKAWGDALAFHKKNKKRKTNNGAAELAAADAKQRAAEKELDQAKADEARLVEKAYAAYLARRAGEREAKAKRRGPQTMDLFPNRAAGAARRNPPRRTYQVTKPRRL